MRPSPVRLAPLALAALLAACGSNEISPDAGDLDGGFSGDVGGVPPVVSCAERGDGLGVMCEVPAGPFFMGCNAAVDSECGPEEKPSRRVELAGFMIDRYEVTVGDYQACVGTGSCTAPHPGDGCNYGKGGRDDHPVNCVDWDQAYVYCAWLGKRLPTEAEWEKAARGIDGRKYPWGDSPEPTCEYAVMFDESACGTRDTQPVGSRARGRGPYGVDDMAGNVWEWVADWYAASYYGVAADVDPQGPEAGVYRVIRGGSWGMSYENYLRVSARWGREPAADFGTIGFRCVRR
jgi:formylglycine-generating enzyme required for sulfatase activity